MNYLELLFFDTTPTIINDFIPINSVVSYLFLYQTTDGCGVPYELQGRDKVTPAFLTNWDPIPWGRVMYGATSKIKKNAVQQFYRIQYFVKYGGSQSELSSLNIWENIYCGTSDQVCSLGSVDERYITENLRIRYQQMQYMVMNNFQTFRLIFKLQPSVDGQTYLFWPQTVTLKP